MPKATTAKKEVISFDQQIIDNVVKQVLTPEKMTELATKMAPVIEKQFAKAVESYVGQMFEDNWRLGELMANDPVIHNAMLIGLRKAMGVEDKVAKMIKKPSKRDGKRLANAPQAIGQNW